MVSLGCWYHLWISNNDPLRAWWSHYMTTNSTNQKRKHQNNVNYGHYPYHNIIIMKIINFVFLTKYVPKIRTKRSAIDALVVIMIMIDPLNLCIMTCFCCGPWANNFVVRPTFWHRLVWLWILLRSLSVYLNIPVSVFYTLILIHWLGHIMIGDANCDTSVSCVFLCPLLFLHLLPTSIASNCKFCLELQVTMYYYTMHDVMLLLLRLKKYLTTWQWWLHQMAIKIQNK